VVFVDVTEDLDW